MASLAATSIRLTTTVSKQTSQPLKEQTPESRRAPLSQKQRSGTSPKDGAKWGPKSADPKTSRAGSKKNPTVKIQPIPEALSDSLKSLMRKHRENVELVSKAVLRAYDVAMTDLVDRLFIPSDEPADLIEGNFAPVPEIGDKVRVQVIEGQVPKDFPPGCYVRNGPNPKFGAHQNLNMPLVNGKILYSWFEGEGMLHATYFEKDGSIWYKNKYVETDTFKAEQEKGRWIYLPTMDEQSVPGVLLNRIINLMRQGKMQRNSGNTSIFEHGGRIVAAVEGGEAYEIDLSDLSTKGEYRCNGQWDRRFFGPHPKIFPDTKEMAIYGFDIYKPYYVMGILSNDGQKITHKVDLGLDRLVLMHDIGITQSHIIVYDFPLVMDVYNMMLRGKSMLSAESNSYARIGVIPVGGDQDSIKWFDVDMAFITHHCNSYQEGDEIVVHALVTRLLQIMSVPKGVGKLEWYARGMTLDHQNNFEDKNPSIDGLLYERLHEWRLNLKTGEVVERDVSKRKFPLELPRINENFQGKKYQYCYAASEDINASKAVGYPKYGRLVKVHVSEDERADFHEVGENTFTSEPVFVPRPGSTIEDDGWIVTYVHNEETHQSDMIIVDSQKFDEKPVARIRLPQRVPYGFHGSYIPSK
ncbi:hypothetical protein MPTK1_4g01260 [Marchantia polymorpha subsp. ruderalis]|uniref:Carotenoid cleavage dioxygenase n=2 Tax=Marchantia polymorpha TaxID=3197 RepID=A0A176WJ02_MARPO|nr:hypothetical protein AXG93_1913s1000 [Marchantia polymorpha subsp. ruderalis]PTQ36055.1 hypothetical protein MARPO_0066s0017 [Marchantia polymorpha]PTQ36056.1 hypothetical protein MARPO_0066s0017 [Marchantia polymorpha]BBN07128.1 hypothetical protein Mp_4g01260 [Marchantia polymorpha subsp. ruderalis]BBN07129.1 hypothetical protein Mp_4g01260 [Marchantia polymorpha subsp. ruderalis]|eukprot:PTQ36055.1 hypothetical protein MARPO_0066s0017 [Marchantia polymorpha]